MSVEILHGRRVVGGVAEGEALVTRQTISGFGGMNPLSGEITERRHEIVGQSFKGKVLLFPGAKGSSGWASNFQAARLAGAAPAAILFTTMSTKIALGAIVMRVPAMTDFDRDPFDMIRTGDRVRVDADAGVVEITRKAG
jgi:predicted aconitase with swiveling domain